MKYIGIDIGSTASKLAIFEENKLIHTSVFATGWSSKETANSIKEYLINNGYVKDSLEDCFIVATGYGRVSVPFAHKTLTEITCHGMGAYYLSKEDCTVIDIGGQDTKVITLEGGRVTSFTMNDKCAAGTGRFLEMMANTLGLEIMEMSELWKSGQGVTISSMCTVFAESEVISLIGQGEKRENIAHGVIESISGKVNSLCQKHGKAEKYFLTGGLCDNPYMLESLEKRLGKPLNTNSLARYAGAIGAALMGKK